jgi:hypothetical protein
VEYKANDDSDPLVLHCNFGVTLWFNPSNLTLSMLYSNLFNIEISSGFPIITLEKRILFSEVKIESSTAKVAAVDTWNFLMFTGKLDSGTAKQTFVGYLNSNTVSFTTVTSNSGFYLYDSPNDPNSIVFGYNSYPMIIY